ncbi:MAG: cyclodeaminase/cyclohydrolase family protein [Tissierellia bacterium]|nr:cyclodeaminase/cyclohydrolase family protein [Tissierellia bacterium]
MLIDYSLDEFIENTKTKKANPGGGAVVSLTGILGINLILMLYNLSSFKDSDIELVKKEKENLERLSDELKAIMQDDVTSFDDVIKAYKIEDKKQRESALKEGYLKAIKPPIDTIDRLMEALNSCENIIKKGSKNALSDGQIGINLIYDAIKSSFYNVDINASHIDDFSYDKFEILKRAKKLKDKYLEILDRRLL